MAAEPRLTPKQQAYVTARIEGLGPSDAYRAAYDCANMLPATISREAVEMESHPKIAPLIAQVQAAVVERLTITAEDISRVAWEIAADGEIQPSARVSALALLAKRHPEFSEKHEVDARVGVMLVRQTRDLNASG